MRAARRAIRRFYRIAFRLSERVPVVRQSAPDGTGDVLLARIAPADADYERNPLGAFALALDEAYLDVPDPGTLSFDADGVPLSQENGRLYRVAR